MTFVERLCRSLCGRTGVHPDALIVPHRLANGPKHGMLVLGNMKPVPAWTVYIGDVLDLLKAAREPSAAMINHGWVGQQSTEPSDTDVIDGWQAMIDAALAEKVTF